MSKPDVPLITIRFAGPRFADHGLDLRDLGALMAIRQILVKYVEQLWREETDKSPPAGFSDSLKFKIYTIEAGSAAISIFDETVDDAPVKQGHLFKRQRPARLRNAEAARRVAKDFQDTAAGEIPNIPKEALPHFKRFTAELSDGDTYELWIPMSRPANESDPVPLLAVLPASGQTSENEVFVQPFDPLDYAAKAPSSPRTSVPISGSPVVLDHAARGRLANYIAMQKPPKPVMQESSEGDEYSVLVEGELAAATISTDEGKAISIEFTPELIRQRAHFAGRGVQDPKANTPIRITEFELRKVSDRPTQEQLPLSLIGGGPSVLAPVEPRAVVETNFGPQRLPPEDINVPPPSFGMLLPAAGNPIAAAMLAIEKGRDLEAVDVLVDHFDDLFRAGAFDVAKNFLASIVPEQMPPKVLTGLLMITSHAREELGEARREFFWGARSALSNRWRLSQEEIESIDRRLK